MARLRRKRGWGKRLLLALAAVPSLYLLAAVLGSVLPVNSGWEEPERGTTVYLRSNGIHVDIVMPAIAQGLDWRPYFPRSDFRNAPSTPRWFTFGAGERQVYLDTPTWWDLKPRTAWTALTGGEQVMHVERTLLMGDQLRAIRLRPEEYRRLWAAVRAGLALTRSGRPQRIDHPGYFGEDAFYRAIGRSSALHTCNNWVADRLRLAGVETSLWSPFGQGFMWRYRRAEPQPAG
jgi:uncharacterized protein (TIGR02117 family)